MSLKNNNNNKDFFRDTNTERVYDQQTWAMCNVKGSHSGQRNTAPGGDPNLQWGMWSARMANMWVNTKTLFLLVSLEDNQLSKAKTIKTVRSRIHLEVEQEWDGKRKEGETLHTAGTRPHCGHSGATSSESRLWRVKAECCKRTTARTTELQLMSQERS